MVDFIKFLPPLFPQIRKKPSCEQISLPIFLTINRNVQNDHSTIIKNTKRWIGRCPGDPPRQLNISDPPYSLHQKIIYRELSRYYPSTTTTTTGDAFASIKVKQQQQKNSNKEPLKVTTVTSNSFLPNVDTSNSRLFHALSKHVTIKPEPLRPGNYFLNNSNNSSSTWQQYWASTQTKRRRKEANDSDSVLYRPKRDPTNLTATHFVTIRDTPVHTNTESKSNSRTSSTIPNIGTPIKLPSPIASAKRSPIVSAKRSPIVSAKRSSIINEDQSFLPPLVLPREETPPMNLIKSIEEKPLSPIESERTIINDDKEIQNEINTITTKIYKLPLPSYKLIMGRTIPKKGSRLKPLEKKQPIMPSTSFEKKETSSTTSLSSTSVPKRKHHTSSNKSHRSTKKKQQSLTTIMTTTPRSKYEQAKWAEPYIGVRYDPPTPPCSPLLFIYRQDTDHDENDLPYEQNSINEIYL